MLLRKLSLHLKKQDWFAAGLDLLIVIAGIFLGLQAQQWYVDRESQEREQVLLLKLRDEISTNNRLARYKIDYRTQVSETGERAIAFLNAERSCAEDCWPLLVDFFLASQATSSPIVSNVISEMQRLGLPSDEGAKNKVENYYVLSDSLADASSINSNYIYRDRVRQLMSSRALKILWETCLGYNTDGLESMLPDCPQGLPNDDVSAILERLQAEPGLKEHMNHWIGMQYPWKLLYKTQIAAGLEAISAIDRALVD